MANAPKRDYKNEPTAFEKLWAFIKPVIEYGKEERDHPDFSIKKYAIRTVVVNIFAAYIAWRGTLMMLESQRHNPGMQPGSQPPAAQSHESEF